MMTESNNLLYHPNDGGFDRLEEMEGGALTRYPVLRSVPVPLTRRWSTRGAIALLMVCGVILGVIAVMTLSGSKGSSETATTETSADANTEELSFLSGSDSLAAGTVETESSWVGRASADSSAQHEAAGSVDDTLAGSTTISSAASKDSHAKDSASGSDGSTSASSNEEVVGNLLEIRDDDSQRGSLSISAVGTTDSQSASVDNVREISGSDSTDASAGWLTDFSDDSDSAADWKLSSSSMSAETSDSQSRSDDGSLEF